MIIEILYWGLVLVLVKGRIIVGYFSFLGVWKINLKEYWFKRGRVERKKWFKVCKVEDIFFEGSSIININYYYWYNFNERYYRLKVLFGVCSWR